MKTALILVVLMSLSNCGSTKLEKKSTFTVDSATYTNWVGGVPGVSGTRVEILIENKAKTVYDKAYFQNIYFQNKITKLEIQQINGKTTLIGHFNTSSRKENNFVLDIDTKKELKNPVPELVKAPFELKENEALISYKVAEKIKYFKIENIKKAKPDMYPRIQ